MLFILQGVVVLRKSDMNVALQKSNQHYFFGRGFAARFFLAGISG